ncbi:hypothetical protein [Shewanella sp. 30m-9]
MFISAKSPRFDLDAQSLIQVEYLVKCIETFEKQQNDNELNSKASSKKSSVYSVQNILSSDEITMLTGLFKLR